MIAAFDAALAHRLRREVAYTGTIREALLQKPDDAEFQEKLSGLLPQGNPEVAMSRCDAEVFEQLLHGNHEIAQIHNFIVKRT